MGNVYFGRGKELGSLLKSENFKNYLKVKIITFDK